MPTVINTNLASLFAQNNLTNAQNNLAQSVQRLSSGLRINSAKDDAAGLAIAQLMQSNINGVNQSIRNLSNATNLLQTADTGLATVQDMLLRMKQLSVQGYDGSLSAAQKINIVTELVDLNAEINATSTRTTFNNINLLGSAKGVDAATGDISVGKFLTQTDVADHTTPGDIRMATQVDFGPPETASVTFSDLTSGQTLTFDGLTFTASTNGATAAQVASAFAGLTSGDTGAEINTLKGLSTSGIGIFTVGSALSTNYTTSQVITGTSGTNKVNFIATSFENKTDIAKTGSGSISELYIQSVRTKAQYEITADPNSDAYRMLPGTYTFNSNGNQLTLSATINGQYMTDTVTVGDAASDVSSEVTTPQELFFDKFGIKLNLTTTVAAGNQTYSGEDTAALFDTKTIKIEGASAKITGIDVSDARSGTYRFTRASANNLKVEFTDRNSNTSSETLDIRTFGTYDSTGANNYVAGSNYSIDFKAMGIKLDLYAYQNLTADQVVTKIAALDNFDINDTTGELYVTEGSADALKFQSGPNSDSFIQINTLNIRTDSNSSNNAMQVLGSRVGVLSGLDASDTVDDWQDAFMNLDNAVEDAQVYISQERAVFGSQMNRLGYLSTNLTSQSTNLQNSRSSIIDTDFASETAKLTRGQIMQQAATAMLAQANQMPNVVLSLLK